MPRTPCPPPSPQPDHHYNPKLDQSARADLHQMQAVLAGIFKLCPSCSKVDRDTCPTTVIVDRMAEAGRFDNVSFDAQTRAYFELTDIATLIEHEYIKGKAPHSAADIRAKNAMVKADAADRFDVRVYRDVSAALHRVQRVNPDRGNPLSTKNAEKLFGIVFDICKVLRTYSKRNTPPDLVEVSELRPTRGVEPHHPRTPAKNHGKERRLLGGK